MISQPIHQIDYETLRNLIGVIRESKTLEFKRELPNGEKGKLKFLAGVTALANSSGGDFIIGADETGGALTAINGIAVEKDDPDAYKRKLSSWLAELVDPALPPFDIHEIACPGDRWAFLVRVPRSWVGPHRVNVDRHFYIRRPASTDPLDVTELRAAFGLRESGVERIEAFRRDRLAKIMAGDTPVPLADGPCAVLHMAPLPSFANRDLIDVVGMMQRGTHMPVPFRGQGGRALVNLHGVCNHTGDGGASNGYGQLFRSGAYESVSASSQDQNGHYWAANEFGNCLVNAVRYALGLQTAYGLAFPTFAMLSLCHADRLRWRIPSEIGVGHYDRPSPGPAVIAFPEILIESASVDVPRAVKPLLDIVWNAYGEPSCPLYNSQGEWRGH